MKTTFTAVVESGSCSRCRRYWEARRECGHKHKTYAAADACGKKRADAKYVCGSWQANADWYYYKIHNQDGERVDESGTTEFELMELVNA